jgi:hypothetical protein
MLHQTLFGAEILEKSFNFSAAVIAASDHALLPPLFTIVVMEGWNSRHSRGFPVFFCLS